MYVKSRWLGVDVFLVCVHVSEWACRRVVCTSAHVCFTCVTLLKKKKLAKYGHALTGHRLFTILANY